MTSSIRFKALFLDAIELSSSERGAFIARAAGSDAELRRRVEELLLAHERAEAAGTTPRKPAYRPKTDSGPPLPAVLGKHELLEVISSGGSGVVYRAQQLDLGRTVAVKLLRSGRFATEDEVQRFKAEAEAAARLDHPSIVPVYEVGSHEGRHYISMKLVDGPGLDRCLVRYVDEPRAAAGLLARIARAVDHAHRRGVLHRDIKPSNVLLDAEGVPHVVDFGTAKLLEDDQRQTMTGCFVGTPTSMAPEQIAVGGECTVATDVYGLGCVLYELLVGRPPFSGATLLETLHQIREMPPPRPRMFVPSLHRDLETICLTCLAKEPARRYGSASALAEDLERWIAREPIRARPISVRESILLAWQRKPVVATLTATVAVLSIVLVVGAIVMSFQLREGLTRTRDAERRAREQTRTAYLEEARALRRGGLAGRRQGALHRLQQAHALRPGKDLVSEAVTSLALTDLVTEQEWPKPGSDVLIGFDATLERYTLRREDGSVELHRSADQELLQTLPGTGQPAWRSRFSADGRYLALTHHSRFGAKNPSFRVWDLQRKVIVYRLDAMPVAKVDFAPGRPVLALLRDDGWLCELDLVTGEERRLTQMGAETVPTMVRYSPEDDRIAVAHLEAGKLDVFTTKGDRICSSTCATDSLTTLCWSPDGTRIAVGSHDLNAYVIDAATGVLITTLTGHRGEVVRTLFPAPGIVATYSWDRSSRLWETDTGRQILSTEDVLIAADRRGSRLGFWREGVMGVKSLDLGSVMRTLHGHAWKSPNCVAVSSTSDLLASGGDRNLILWDLASGKRLDAREREQVVGLVFARSGDLYVASSRGLERFGLQDGRLQGPAKSILQGPCKSLASTPNGGQLAALSGGEIHLFVDGEDDPVGRIKVPDRTRRLSISPDGMYVVVGSWRGSGVRVFDTRDGSPVAHLWPEESNCTPWFSPDGEHLLIGTEHGYEVHEGHDFKLSSHGAHRVRNNLAATVASYSRQGKRLAIRQERSKILLLDALSGKKLVTLESPDPQIPNDACFSPDGRYLTLATDCNHVLLWDLIKLDQELKALGLPMLSTGESGR